MNHVGIHAAAVAPLAVAADKRSRQLDAPALWALRVLNAVVNGRRTSSLPAQKQTNIGHVDVTGDPSGPLPVLELFFERPTPRNNSASVDACGASALLQLKNARTVASGTPSSSNVSLAPPWTPVPSRSFAVTHVGESKCGQHITSTS